MSFIPWDSQPFEEWARRHAPGKFIDLNGRKTHYVEKGSGDPVILLHGFAYDSYLWAENIDALARHFKVYAFDLWGTGYSTREPLDYGYPLYAEQLRLFMDALGIARASLVGQSMGGGTAVYFCVRHRERVDKLVLVDVAGLRNPLPLLARISMLPKVGEFFLGLNTDAFRRKSLADFFVRDKRRITDEYFANVTRAQKIEGSSRAAVAILRKRFFDTLTDDIHRLGSMNVPTLIVWGRHDRSISVRLGEQFHRILRGSRFEVLDDAAHVANFDRADEFNRLAIEFLKSV